MKRRLLYILLLTLLLMPFVKAQVRMDQVTGLLDSLFKKADKDSVSQDVTDRPTFDQSIYLRSFDHYGGADTNTAAENKIALDSMETTLTNDTSEVVFARKYILDQDTIPDNITMNFIGGTITLGAGDTLRIQGGIKAGREQIFFGEGVVDFSGTSTSLIYPEWFGVSQKNSKTLNKSAFEVLERAVSNDTSEIYITEKYIIDDDTLPSSMNLNFSGKGGFFLGTGDTLKILGTFKAPIKQIFHGTGYVDITRAKVDKIYPEWFGAKGDSATDNLTPLGRIFLNGGNKEIVFTDSVYRVSAKINTNLQGKDLSVTSTNNSKLFSLYTTSAGAYETSEAVFEFSNGGNISIEGVTFQGTSRSAGVKIVPGLGTAGQNYLSLLSIHDAGNVALSGVTITNAIYAGIRAFDVDKISITNSIIDSCNYAGAFIYRAGQGTVTGNEISYNGISSYAYGYGISFSHRWGEAVDNQGVDISFNKCFYNTRKAIDFHNAIGVKVLSNHIKGYLWDAIAGVNEAGSDPDVPAEIDPLWAKRVTDVLIAYNYIENDSAWFVLQTYGDSHSAIEVGSYSNTAIGGGSIIVHSNIIKNQNMSVQRAPIFVFLNTDGTAHEAISIKDNIIWDAQVSATWQSDGVIYLIPGDVIPKFVDISGNNIYGSSLNGIKVEMQNPSELQLSTVNINNNNLNGTFTYPLFITRDLRQVTSNNTYNGDTLPEMIDRFMGKIEKTLITQGTSDQVVLLTLDANGFTTGAMNFDVKVNAGSAGNFYQAVFHYSAYGGNNEGVTAFGTDTLDYTFWSPATVDPDDYIPALTWTGSGDTRTLTFTGTVTYTGYTIVVEYSSWRLQLLRTQ